MVVAGNEKGSSQTEGPSAEIFVDVHSFGFLTFEETLWCSIYWRCYLSGFMTREHLLGQLAATTTETDLPSNQDTVDILLLTIITSSHVDVLAVLLLNAALTCVHPDVTKMMQPGT